MSVGGDGKIKIISVGGGESRGVDDDGQIHVVAEMEEAHGHADINCVQWCPQMTFEKSTTTTSSNSSSSTSLNYETTSMDHDKMKQQEQEKLWNDYLGYLFLTAGDDGLVKVWRLVM